MKKKILIALFMILIFFKVECLSQSIEGDQNSLKTKEILDKINWTFDFEKGKQEAKNQNKLMILFCFADWCSGSKSFINDVLSDSNVINFFNENIPILLDISNITETKITLQKYLNITQIPSVLFLESNGNEIARVINLEKKEDFLKKIKTITNKSQR